MILTHLSYGQDSLKIVNRDTTKLKDVFSKGKLEVSARSFFMSTTNEGVLKDDYALASGVGVGFVSKSFHGFQVGVSSFVTYNLSSSNLAQLD